MNTASTRPLYKRPLRKSAIGGAKFTIGTESADVINVAVQLLDEFGADLAERGAVMTYLSDDANGDSHHGADAALSAAVGTDGVLVDLATDGPYLLISETDGDIDVNFTKTDADTLFLIVILPDGTLAASAAITWT